MEISIKCHDLECNIISILFNIIDSQRHMRMKFTWKPPFFVSAGQFNLDNTGPNSNDTLYDQIVYENNKASYRVSFNLKKKERGVTRICCVFIDNL